MHLTDQGLEEIEQYASEKKNANILLAIQVLKEIRELNARVDALEKRVQSQPLEIVGALSALRHKEMTKSGSSSPWKKHASDTGQTISGQELEYLRKQSTNAVIESLANEVDKAVDLISRDQNSKSN